MKSISFTIEKLILKELNDKYPNLGKNKDVGDFGVAVATLYLEHMGAADIAKEPEPGVDFSAVLNGKQIKFEVKATVDSEVAFSKLKISSTTSHDLLVDGMEIISIFCSVLGLI